MEQNKDNKTTRNVWGNRTKTSTPIKSFKELLQEEEEKKKEEQLNGWYYILK
jgi:hypothetical protein